MRKLNCEDLRQVVWLSEPALSSDGIKAAFTRAVSDYQSGKNLSQVWEVPTIGGEAVPVSRKTKTQRRPGYSPDGRFLVFLSEDSGEPQLWVKDRATGEERCLLALRYGVWEYAFSPDGRRIAFVTKQPADFFCSQEDLSVLLTEEERISLSWEKQHAPRIAENLIYKYDDDSGFREQSVTRIGLMDLENGIWKLVSPEEFPCRMPSFGNDCLYYYGCPEKHEKELRLALYRLRDGEETPERIKTSQMIYSAVPVKERDGHPVYLGMDIQEDTWLTKPYVAAESGEEDVSLFDGTEACHGVDNLLIGDNHMGGQNPCWQGSKDGFYFLSASMGTPGVWRWQEERGAEKVLSGGTILDFAAPREGKLLFLRSRYNVPASLWVKHLDTREEKPLFADNAWTEKIEFRKPAEMWVPSRDGKVKIHGFVLMPEGQERCPGVLYIHGGPEAFTVGDGFYFDAQALAARGIAVLYCDPRGSTGYGREFVSEKCSWGQEAVEDLEDFMQASIQRFPRIDGNRMGVTGGSYGGYMTMKLLLTTKLFKAGCAQRPFVNPETSYGTGDMGFISGSGKKDFVQYMLDRAKSSMMKDVRNLSVPLLLLHGEADLRCGVEQSDQIFVLMRALHPEIPCRMVLFPGENHGVNRTGLMHNQIRHSKELCDWMEKYLQEGGEEPCEA